MKMDKQPIKKLRLYGFADLGNRIQIILAKDRNFFEIFGELVPNSDFADNGYVNKRGQWISKTRYMTEKFIDEIERPNDEMGIIYGNKRIFITIFTNSKSKGKLIEKIKNITEWVPKVSFQCL